MTVHVRSAISARLFAVARVIKWTRPLRVIKWTRSAPLVTAALTS
jgi:hypothetical protein